MTSRQYAEVIGDPIAQSLSPAIHTFWLKKLGIEADYGRKQVTRADLKAYLDTARADPNSRELSLMRAIAIEVVKNLERVRRGLAVQQEEPGQRGDAPTPES